MPVNYLPQTLNDLWEPQRSFAVAHLPVAGTKGVCGHVADVDVGLMTLCCINSYAKCNVQTGC